jgi:hypothetical protein
VVVGGSVLGILSLLVLVYCVLDIATSRPQDVRGLPKPVWFVVVFLPLLGPLAWYLAGRPQPGSARNVPRVLPDAAPPASTPDDDEEFLRELRRRAEQQRRQGQRHDSDGQPGRDDDRPA